MADPAPYCTVSIGVTTNRQDTDTVDTLLARADAAMYRAKANGRNQARSPLVCLEPGRMIQSVCDRPASSQPRQKPAR